MAKEDRCSTAIQNDRGTRSGSMCSDELNSLGEPGPSVERYDDAARRAATGDRLSRTRAGHCGIPSAADLTAALALMML